MKIIIIAWVMLSEGQMMSNPYTFTPPNGFASIADCRDQKERLEKAVRDGGAELIHPLAVDAWFHCKEVEIAGGGKRV